MQARIIDLTDSIVYLEIDQQLRFRSSYVAAQGIDYLNRSDCVDFRFQQAGNSPIIVIESVQHLSPGTPPPA